MTGGNIRRRKEICHCHLSAFGGNDDALSGDVFLGFGDMPLNLGKMLALAFAIGVSMFEAACFAPSKAFNISTTSFISQSRLVTPAAITGIILSVWWMRTKL
jgi:hypothetical protein